MEGLGGARSREEGMLLRRGNRGKGRGRGRGREEEGMGVMVVIGGRMGGIERVG